MADQAAGWAGFATAALNALGRSAPWVVIGCLSGFGIYVLQNQSQENFNQLRTIAAEERRLAASDFQAANQTLQDTYGSITRLTDELMTSFQSQLTQLRTLEDSVREKQGEVFDRRIEVERTLVEIANQRIELERSRNELERSGNELNQLTAAVEARREEVDRAVQALAEAEQGREMALSDAEELRTELASEQGRLQGTRAELDRNRQQLQEISRQLDERRVELDQAVEKVRDVLAVLRDVANADPDAFPANLVALQERAREVVPQVSDFLSTYADDPQNRSTLNATSIIGASMNELKDAMYGTQPIVWYLVRDSRSDDNLASEIMGVPMEAHGTSAVPHAIRISMSSSVDMNELLAYFRSESSDDTIDDITISSARLGSSVAFGCIDTDNYRRVRTCRVGEESRGWSSRWPESPFSYVLNHNRTAPIIDIDDPMIVALPVSEAAQFAHTYGLMREAGDINRYMPSLTLTFARYLNRLARLQINLVSTDVSDAERTQLSSWISGHYARVFHPEYDFVTPIVFVPGDENDSDLIASFVSELAAEALSRDIEIVDVMVARTEAGFSLQLPELEDTFAVGVRRLTLEGVDETGEFDVLASN